MDHRCQIQILAELFRSRLELGVVDAVYTLLDADDFLHNVDALHVFALSYRCSTFF